MGPALLYILKRLQGQRGKYILLSLSSFLLGQAIERSFLLSSSRPFLAQSIYLLCALLSFSFLFFLLRALRERLQLQDKGLFLFALFLLLFLLGLDYPLRAYGTLRLLTVELVPSLVGSIKRLLESFALLFFALALYGQPVERFLSSMERVFTKWVKRPWIFLTVLFILGLVATASVSFFVLEGMPDIVDSVGYFFQAKVFLSGHLFVRPHPLREFFSYKPLIETGDKWLAQYPPGFPFLLMLGLAINMPWLVNPLLGSLTLIVVYLLGREIGSGKTLSGLAAVLCLTSPHWLMMSSLMLSHSSSLLFSSLFLLFMLKSLKGSGGWKSPFFAGLFLGTAITIRPLSPLTLAMPFLTYLLWRSMREPSLLFKRLSPLSVGLGLMLSLLLAYNYFTTGSAFTFGYEVRDWPHEAGLLKQPYASSSLNFKVALVNTYFHVNGLLRDLFPWPLPFLWLLIVWLFFSEKNMLEKLMAVGALSVLTFHGIIPWYFSTGLGPRKVYEVMPILVLLSLRGSVYLPALFPSHRQKAASLLVLLLILCIVSCLVFAHPILLKRLEEGFGIDTKVYKTVKGQGIEEALVFISPDPFNPFLYGSGFMYNSPDLKDKILFARDLGKKNSQLMALYPEKESYLYEGVGETLKKIER